MTKVVVAHLPLFLICGSQAITYALSQAGLYGQLPQKRLWVGSWERLQPILTTDLVLLQSRVHTRSSR